MVQMGYMVPVPGERASGACFDGRHGLCTSGSAITQTLWGGIDTSCTCACHWAVTDHCATGDHSRCHDLRRECDPRSYGSHWVNCPCPCHTILQRQQLLDLYRRVVEMW